MPLGEVQGEGREDSEVKPLPLCVRATTVGVFAKEGVNVGDSVPVIPMLPLPVGVLAPTEPVGVAVVVATADTLPPTSTPVAVRLAVRAELRELVALAEEVMEGELVRVADAEGEAVGVGVSVLGRWVTEFVEVGEVVEV